MAVYIHNQRLLADSLEELHAAAAQAGISPMWFKPSPPAIVPHYTLNGREHITAAVKHGARHGAVYEDEIHDCRLLWRRMTAKRFLDGRRAR